jgi:lipoprotein-anchoring transpeptidase ErfK/SrfK
MKIGLGVFLRRQMRVVRGVTCAVLLILVACVGGTTSAGIYTMPWYQQLGLNPVFARQVVGYPTHERPGTIIIDPASHFLYLIHDAVQAIRYGVGVGKEGFVWSGLATVHSKQEWPDWYPPAEMLVRKPEIRRYMVKMPGGLGMKGGPENPLGARALYLYSGNKDTLYRIHGTNEPWTIGTNVSSGCIRLTNEDIVDLYNRTPIGAKVFVFGAGKPAGLGNRAATVTP